MRRPVVLLAFGDEDSRTIYSVYLTHVGVSVRIARDGAEALVLARAHRPDVLVTEHRLPVIDGYDLAERIRREEAARSTPVVLVAAWDSLVDRLRARKAGISTFRSLPLRPDVLLDDVRRLTSTGGVPLG